ncbi:MAG: biotin-dependent carboxyltransferase family protein [Pseudomonadales bacterium]
MHLGVSRSGALDAFALQLGNLALGNCRSSAGIEILRGEIHVRSEQDSWIAVSGTHMDAAVYGVSGNIRDTLRAGSPIALLQGELLRLRNRRATGCAYLTVGGGIDCPPVLGSCSTDLAAGFGGLDGRALRRGDRIVAGALSPSQQSMLQATCKPCAPYSLREVSPDTMLRALPGPEFEQASALFGEHFWRTRFIVSPQANRMGARLVPSKQRDHLPRQEGAGMLASHAVAPGTVQLPSQAEAIVLLADAQTTGGYPRIAQVIAADLWKIVQLPAGSEVHFQAVDLAAAAQALAGRNSGLARAEIAVQHRQRRIAGTSQP